METTIRGLLTAGNEKLSAGVWHFDLPAVSTCPGRSAMCTSRCYARRGRFAFPQVKERFAWNYAQSKRDDFADRMVRELYRKGVILMRFHVSGDIFSPGYAKKVLDIIRRSEHCTFWFYTRSWRVPAILPVLREISALSNCKVWLSADAETGYPTDVPEGARVAWMQTEEEDGCEDADLVFLDRPLRKFELTLANVCPAETPKGKEKGTTCATCRKCWTG